MYVRVCSSPYSRCVWFFRGSEGAVNVFVLHTYGRPRHAEKAIVSRSNR